MAAVLANEFAEATGDLYLHALVEIGLVLFVITLIINVDLPDVHLVDGPPAAAAAAPSRRGGAGGMMRDRLAPVAVSHVIIVLCGAVGAHRAGAAGVRAVLCRQPGRHVAEPRLLHARRPSRSAKSGGGMANAIVGSLIVTGLGALFAIPIGIMSGIYAAEYAGTRLASAVRFAADTLNGVPSIVIGVFVYSIAVLPFGGFSALAGGLALGIMMIPLIMRTTEELLRLVPSTLREGALALGATRGARRVHASSCRRRCPGILTGILLALARIAGETAPLLFTALNNGSGRTDITQPISTLTVQVFTYAIAPYEDWHRQAWAGALVLVAMVLLCSLLARVATARMERLQRG